MDLGIQHGMEGFAEEVTFKLDLNQREELDHERRWKVNLRRGISFKRGMGI